jgi:hypothetical protein
MVSESRRERARRTSRHIDALRRDDHEQELELRARLEEREAILAFARDMPTSGDERSRASAFAGGLVAATDRRVLWRELDDRGRSEPREIHLDEVVAADGVSEHHRWHLELEHGPIERITHVPAYHVGFIAGGNKQIRRSWRRSSFSFSRRDRRWRSSFAPSSHVERSRSASIPPLRRRRVSIVPAASCSPPWAGNHEGSTGRSCSGVEQRAEVADHAVTVELGGPALERSSPTAAAPSQNGTWSSTNTVSAGATSPTASSAAR